MKNNKKIIASIILVIIWMIVIFIFSAMTSNESNAKSKKLISKVIEKVESREEVNTSQENKNNQQKENEEIKENKITTEANNKPTYLVVNELNQPLRKCAHASVYFVLCIFVANLILEVKNKLKITYGIISIGICFLYACTDELHQLFVDGRTGQFTDVLIDTAGAILGCIVFYIIYKLRHKKSKKVREDVL